MTEVVFYILPTHSPNERLLFVCKLVEKAYRQQQGLYIFNESEQQSQYLDRQLWTFRAGSFIPHQIFQGESPEFFQTVLCGTLDAPKSWQTVIINLSHTLPRYTESTQRIIEVLDNNDTLMSAGRERYRQYHQMGLDITTHKI